MIDVTKLTQLISAFRVETEKESISPETVGSILQDITDLLGTASTEAERNTVEDLVALLRNEMNSLQQRTTTLGTKLTTAQGDIDALQKAMQTVQRGGTFVDNAMVSMVDSNRVALTLLGYDVRTGEQQLELQTIIIPAATSGGAGVMTTTQVKQLEAVRQAVFGSGNTAITTNYYPLAIRVNKGVDALILRGYEPLVAKGYVPYLFRYSAKRNSSKDEEKQRRHGVLRKGWNVVGRADTLRLNTIGNVSINKNVFKHPLMDEDELGELAKYQMKPEFFISERVEKETGVTYVPYGRTKVDLALKQTDGSGSYKRRVVRLLYGIAFASETVGARNLLDMSKLVTPIVPFHVSAVYEKDAETHKWIFER